VPVVFNSSHTSWARRRSITKQTKHHFIASHRGITRENQQECPQHTSRWVQIRRNSRIKVLLRRCLEGTQWWALVHRHDSTTTIAGTVHGVLILRHQVAKINQSVEKVEDERARNDLEVVEFTNQASKSLL
jgi:hypothetical protein